MRRPLIGEGKNSKVVSFGSGASIGRDYLITECSEAENSFEDAQKLGLGRNFSNEPPPAARRNIIAFGLTTRPEPRQAIVSAGRSARCRSCRCRSSETRTPPGSLCADQR